MACDCGHAFNAQGTAWVQKERDAGAVPNLRGPNIFAKIGVGIAGYICGALPFAIIATALEMHTGRKVNMSGAMLGGGIVGAVMGVRLLKRQYQKIRR
jgi:hypothetical protein